MKHILTREGAICGARIHEITKEAVNVVRSTFEIREISEAPCFEKEFITGLEQVGEPIN